MYQIVKMSYLHTAFILVALVLSCSSEDMESNSMPSALTLDIRLVGADDAHPNGDGSGTVHVSASAKNDAFV